MIYDIRVAGIPAKAEVTYYVHQPAMGKWADSDWDANGYTDLDWNLLDRRGKPAGKWLEAKLTGKVLDDVKEQIAKCIEDDAKQAADDHAADHYESEHGGYY